MTQIKFPYVNVPITGSNASAQNTAQKVLIIGQSYEGTITDGQWYRNVPSDESIYGPIVGKKSMIFQTIRQMRRINNAVQFDLITVPDAPSSVVASSLVDFQDEESSIELSSLTFDGMEARASSVEENYLANFDEITISGSSVAALNGTFPITVTDSFSFGFSAIGSPGTDDGSASLVAKTGAAESGELEFYFSSQRDNTFTIGVSAGDRSADIKPLLISAINASETAPFIAESGSNNTLFVRRTNAGAIFNEAPCDIVSSVSGIAVEVQSFGGGSVDPELDSVLDIIGDQRYQTIVWPYNGDLDIVSQFLDARFNADGEVEDGVAFSAKADTFANLLTLGNEFNSNSLVVVGCEGSSALTSNNSNDIAEAPWDIAAQAASIRALRLQPDANIAQYVITNRGGLDAIGGPALASKPYANTPLPQLPISLSGRGFSKLETSQLNDSGITVFGNNKANNAVIMGQVVTTYKNDSAGNPDITYKYLNYVDTASAGREYIYNSLRADNAQTRLTSGNLIKGRTMTNADTITADMVGYYQELADTDFVIARKGEEELVYFKRNLSVVTDQETGSANVVFSLPIVTQLRRINAPMQLTFNLE